MSIPLVGIMVSSMSIFLLSILFHAEKKRGRRFLEPVRLMFDQVVARVGAVSDRLFEHMTGDVVRQILHFLLHTVLMVIFNFLKQCEAYVENLLRSNRILAGKVKRERSTRNKLDEIADHKVSVALTEEEKRIRKEMSLNG